VSRAPRNRPGERAAIQAAANRLLAGTPLRSRSGNLSATELIAESGLARWKVYEHRDLIEQFQARVKAAGAVPDAMRDLAVQNKRLAEELVKTTAALRAEQARTAMLRRALTETSIELAHAREEADTDATVTRLPTTRRSRSR
jgi:hypothetical protein